MVHRQLCKLSKRSCNSISAASQKQPKGLLHRFSFFSSESATNQSSFNSRPKFPIIPGYYDGKSKPIPKRDVAPSCAPPSSHQPRDHSREQQHQLEIADALRPSYESRTPLLLRNLHASCDAVYFWRSLEYWRVAVGGDAPVEVEFGKSYNEGKRVTMRFGDYLDYLALCMEQEGKDEQRQKVEQEEEVGYLAQNELFPQVLTDIPIPNFCDDDEYNVGAGRLYHTMLWMGPRNTVSALHFDPLDNLLMQVVGWKRVLLFPPDNHSCGEKGDNESTRNNRYGSHESPSWHYAGAKGNQYNTSAVDVENPDHDQFPNFRASPTPYECILGPGDGLYIPKKWWHHVRSLEMSVSANVWWR